MVVLASLVPCWASCYFYICSGRWSRKISVSGRLFLALEVPLVGSCTGVMLVRLVTGVSGDWLVPPACHLL